MNFAIDSSKRSSFHAVFDIAGYLFASLLIIWVTWKIENILDEQQPFNYVGIIVLFAIFVVSYGAVYFRYGNRTKLGIPCLALTSILAAFVYVGGSIAVTSFLHSAQGLSSIDVGQILFFVGSLFCVSFIIVLTLRLVFLVLLSLFRIAFSKDTPG